MDVIPDPNPEKYPNTFKNLFKKQITKFADLSELIDAMEVDEKVKWAQKGLAYVKENPSKDLLQLPLVHSAKTGTGKIGIVDVDSDGATFRSKSTGARGGVHGGTTVKG